MLQPGKTQYIIQIVTENSYWTQKKQENTEKQLWQFYCKLFLQIQKRCNSSVIPIFTQFVIIQLCHFTNQAQGDRRMIFHLEIDTKWFITKCKEISN